MEYHGRKLSGEGITVAVIDSGVDARDPRLTGTTVEGYNIRFGATGHALLGADFHDESGHGTEVAAAVVRMAPHARILAVKIMDAQLKTTADLMAAGIETAYRNGSQVINLSLGTSNMGKALLLRDCCALAAEAGSVIVAAANPKGERAYPADLPEVIGVFAHPECPFEKCWWFNPTTYPASQWKGLSGKYLACGYAFPLSGVTAGRVWRGSGVATAYMSGRVACLRQADPQGPIVEQIREIAHVPEPDAGYR
ncbi:MAG: S8 family serine peptidase [Deltaproteobacteria bacterium]|nr:S8 family serine peptidase [Deltaproteobacteria bacterium]